MNSIRSFSERAVLAVLSRVERRASSWKKTLERRRNSNPAAGPPEIRSNRELRNLHQGRRAFVIGNGPSLAKQDLRLLRDEVTFVMNGFWKHEAVGEWQPDYYCLADPIYFDGTDAMSVFFSDLRRRVTASTFLVPVSAKPQIVALGLLPPERTRYIAFHGELKDGLERMPDLSAAVPGVQSVSQLAIMAAMYTGCSPIYLLGMDHDWLAQRGMDRHFYADQTVAGHPVAHGNLDGYTYASDLEAALKLWRGYEALSRVAAAGGSHILNASHGGFLDVFPRVDYQTLVEPRATTSSQPKQRQS